MRLDFVRWITGFEEEVVINNNNNIEESTDIIEEMKIYNGNVLIMAGTADKDEYYIDLYTRASKAFSNARFPVISFSSSDVL